MKAPDQMKSAFASLLLALLMLLGLEYWVSRDPWLGERVKNTNFFLRPDAEPEAPEAAPAQAPAAAEKPSLTPVAAHTTRLDVRRLFADLEKRKLPRLRIAYFADSITEGDVITEQLRRDLQALYGGKGPGFQGISPRDATFRVSLNHRPSKQWKRVDLHDWRKNHALPLCINGEAYHLAEGEKSGTLRLEPTSKAPLPWYSQATLYWGRGALKLGIDGQRFELNGAGPFNAFPLPLSPTPEKLRLEFRPAPGTWVYGLSLDSPEGVTLDNFTFRGNGGDSLANLDGAMLRAGQAALHYDLVLLHFGINAMHEGDTEYHWYRAGLHRAYEHFKSNLPGARIVVLGVMDHAVKSKSGKVHSDSSLPYVLAAQEAAAKDAGLWYINLYSMMGGPGVMKSWVERPEPLASRDYTHPNRKGGARLAAYIRSALLGEPLPRTKDTEAPHAP